MNFLFFLFFFYQSTSLSSNTVDGHQMYSKFAEVGYMYPWGPLGRNVPLHKIAWRKRAKSSITQPWIIQFRSNMPMTSN